MNSREHVKEWLAHTVTTLEELPMGLQNWSRELKESRDENPSNRRNDDEHRKSAYGRIDELLEEGTIDHKEAEKFKKDWDLRHGYY